MPELRHAELIGGVVFFMASPASRSHGNVHVRFGGRLDRYADSTRGCDVGMDTTWLMARGNVPQPDLYRRILPSHGGQSRDQGEYNAGAPELAVEVRGPPLRTTLA